LLTLPEPIIQDDEKVVLGLDGRKMSKSYGNVIPLLEDEKVLRKSVMKIVTNSLEPGVPKNSKDCTVFDLYRNFADDNNVAEFQDKYDNGISWGEAKEILFNAINNELKPIRSRYEDLIKDKNFINDVLSEGSKNARLIAQEKISEIREVIGIKKIS
jgi:tryptophanyl-tRNA synthetase